MLPREAVSEMCTSTSPVIELNREHSGPCSPSALGPSFLSIINVVIVLPYRVLLTSLTSLTRVLSWHGGWRSSLFGIICTGRQQPLGQAASTRLGRELVE